MPAFTIPFSFLFPEPAVTIRFPAKKFPKILYQNHFYFWIPASITEEAAVIPNGVKTCFAKGIATFLNGPANLLNNDPKNPPD